MINAEITFYNVGLSDKNLPYNRTALVNILAAGVIKNGGQTYKLRLTDLAFGTPINIDEATYQIVASATYIEIYTKDENNQNDQYRYCFINNFLRLANGNWAVSYTIDDWTSFYIGGQSGTSSPYIIHIDGFTERANVPLIEKPTPAVGGNYIFRSNKIPLTGKRDANNGGIKKYFKESLNRDQKTYDNVMYTTGLPLGYICAVYFISAPKYNGNPSIYANAHGLLYDHNIAGDKPKAIERLNSNTYCMVFKPVQFGSLTELRNIKVKDAHGETVIAANQFSITDPDDDTIEKIMYFDFIPSPDISGGRYYNHEEDCFYIISSQSSSYHIELADIFHYSGNTYYQAVKMLYFSPLQEADITVNVPVWQGINFTKKATYQDYIDSSLYQYIQESVSLKVKYLTAELEIPIDILFGWLFDEEIQPLGRYLQSKILVSYSGDGETLVLRYKVRSAKTTNEPAGMTAELKQQINKDERSATAQNINYFDLVMARDFKAYKNSKITGAAGIAATTVGSVVALGSSITTGNVAGMYGALSGGATGILSGVQKLQGLTPYKQSPANGDITLTKMTNDVNHVIFEIEEDLPNVKKARIKYLEENGALVSMPFDEYMNTCQMEAFNAIKMANVDVSGAPQQIARRIEEALLSGVTLWTATDVGNKKVINYPLETGA